MEYNPFYRYRLMFMFDSNAATRQYSRITFVCNTHNMIQ